METFKKEVKRIGKYSLGIVIPKDIVKYMQLHPSTILEVSIKIAGDEMSNYICSKCQHPFASSDIKPFCPVCGCEDLEELTE